MEEREEQGKSVEIQSLELMGVFLLIFGSLIIIAAFFPMDLTGRMANVIVGGLLTAVGAALFLKGRGYRKARQGGS